MSACQACQETTSSTRERSIGVIGELLGIWAFGAQKVAMHIWGSLAKATFIVAFQQYIGLLSFELRQCAWLCMQDRYPSVLSAHQLHMVELFHALAGFTSQERIGEMPSIMTWDVRNTCRTLLVHPYMTRGSILRSL